VSDPSVLGPGVCWSRARRSGHRRRFPGQGYANEAR
jgi:hypothetical protein